LGFSQLFRQPATQLPLLLAVVCAVAFCVTGCRAAAHLVHMIRELNVPPHRIKHSARMKPSGMKHRDFSVLLQ
jgi:hypothetical protein